MLAALALAALVGCSSRGEPAGAPAVTSPPPAGSAGPSTPPGQGASLPAKVILTGSQGEVTVGVEVVSTPAAIQRGLMYREYLAPDAGMLFLMPDEDVQRFWMRNTLIPLDMLFINKELEVVGVVAQAEPRTETSRHVDRPSSYVLEVNGGWAAAHGVGAGARARFDGVPARSPAP